MELKSLILGLAFSVGVFAVKSGAGLAYMLRRNRGIKRRIAAISVFLTAYGAVFLLSRFLVTRIDLTASIDGMMMFFKSGMTLHLVLAGLMLLWGTGLLKRRTGGDEQSRGWFLLAVPCPVCFSVILFSSAFLYSMRPDAPLVFVCFFAGFAALSLVSALCFSLVRVDTPEHGLGAVMVLTALYFLITIAVVPQFRDAERVYRLGLGSAPGISLKQAFFLAAGTGLAFTAGALKTIWRPSWK